MTEYSIFYYPYVSFKGKQELHLKAAALYFHKPCILDPVKVSWDGIVSNPLIDESMIDNAGQDNFINTDGQLYRADLRDDKLFLNYFEKQLIGGLE